MYFLASLYKKIFLVAVFLLLPFSVVFAGWSKKPEFRWEQLYRCDDRRENKELYTNRISLTFDYLNQEKSPLFKLTPYFEIRRNIDLDHWERKELGLEIGKNITSWFYVGQAIQKGWMKEDYRYSGFYETRDYVESENRVLFGHTILRNRHIHLKGFILNEYTYDFNVGKGMRNEVAIGLISPLYKFLEADIDWRHIDRVNHYDSDTFEFALAMVF